MQQIIKCANVDGGIKIYSPWKRMWPLLYMCKVRRQVEEDDLKHNRGRIIALIVKYKENNNNKCTIKGGKMGGIT
jgi:hypothetical protein